MRGKQLCKVTAFLLIGILLFICVQSVFLPNWNIHNVGHTLAGYRALEENSVEAVFLGTSLVACGISPMKIYEDTGISTYNLGVDAQSIQTSYFLLKDFLKTQKPSVVFLDPSNLFYKEITLSFYRVVMDLLYPTDIGLEMAMEYKDLSGEGLLYGLVPLAAYHDRWDELKRTDFDPALKGPYYTMGYCMMPYTAPVNEAVMDVIRQNLEDMRADGQAAEKAIIPGYAEDYLVKMLQLCREQNIRLVIAKMPSFRSIMYDGWTEERAAAVTALAEKIRHRVSGYDNQYTGG